VQKKAKFGIGIGVIVVSMAALAWLGYGESKTYYHTIAELPALQGSARAHRLRVGGTVEPGSIRRAPGRVNFVLQRSSARYVYRQVAGAGGRQPGERRKFRGGAGAS
jgi:cytochrome c-type biogenesis protein CcmE